MVCFVALTGAKTMVSASFKVLKALTRDCVRRDSVILVLLAISYISPLIKYLPSALMYAVLEPNVISYMPGIFVARTSSGFAPGNFRASCTRMSSDLPAAAAGFVG